MASLKSKPEHDKGFSLMELMMSVAIASVSILAVVSVSQNINKASLSQSSTASADNLTSIIAQNLRFQSTCSTTIRNGANAIAFNNAQALTTANPTVGLPLAITLEGLRAGPGGNINQITGSNNAVTSGAAPTYAGATSELPAMSLKIQRIAFQKIAQDSTGTRHFGIVYMDLEKDDTGGKVSLGGNAIRRKYLGGVILVVSGGNIVDCYGNSGTSDLAQICTSMGCTFNGTSCNCPRGEFTCPPGSYLVNITNGIPTCKKLGTSSPCPAGQYLVGIGLESIECAPVPDEVIIPPAPPLVCPAGTSTSGAGGAASPAGCSCNSAGQTWNGTTCVAASCSPAGSMYTWNGLNWDDYFSPTWSMATIGFASTAAPSSLPPVGSNLGSGIVRTHTNTVTCGALTCPAGTSTTGAGGAALPAGCSCDTAGQTWNGSSCVAPAQAPVACYYREERTPSAPCDTSTVDYGMDATCGGPHPPTSCGSVAGPAFQCRAANVGSPEAASACTGGGPPSSYCGQYHFEQPNMLAEVCSTGTVITAMETTSFQICPGGYYSEPAPSDSCNGKPVMKCIICGPGSTPGNCLLNPTCVVTP
jgi:prepilin-type N-terminal cleavage/methylation domain-containing protein